MTVVVAPLLLGLTLAAGLDQAKPDFSGKWTKISTSPREALEMVTISQTADTLTVEEHARMDPPNRVARWIHKLDGSESKNVTPEGTARVSTTTWDGDSLVTRTPIRETASVLTTVVRLEGTTLVIQATSAIEATGAVQNQVTKKYSKTPR